MRRLSREGRNSPPGSNAPCFPSKTARAKVIEVYQRAALSRLRLATETIEFTDDPSRPSGRILAEDVRRRSQLSAIQSLDPRRICRARRRRSGGRARNCG